MRSPTYFQNKLRAEATAVGHLREGPESEHKFHRSSAITKPSMGRKVLAGERLPGMSVTHTGLSLARGALNRHKPNLDRTPRFATEKKALQSNLDVD